MAASLKGPPPSPECVPEPRPLPKTIPVSVLRDRGPLSVHQALAVWLCEDADGPQLTQQQAADVLGIKDRRDVNMHLRRARDILGRRK